MQMMVKLSKHSQALLTQYLETCLNQLDDFAEVEELVSVETIVFWLKEGPKSSERSKKKSKEDTEFIIASLRAQLLKDLNESLDGHIKPHLESSKPFNKGKFIMLAAAGTLVAACQGFDSISTLIGIFSLPSAVTLVGGLLFSILSVAVFFGFDLVQISQTMGVKIKDAPKLLDIYLLQKNEIKSIRKKIASYRLTELSLDELAQTEMILTMLESEFKKLQASGKQFHAAVNSKTMGLAKYVFTGMSGLLYFGGGFFAGQSVAIFMLGLFMTSVTPVFWPVILFSVVVGIAALSLYWFVQREGLSKLIGSLVGLDEEKIESLCNVDKLAKEEGKIAALKDNVLGIMQLKSERSNLTPARKVASTPQNDADCENNISCKPAQSHTLASANIYRFHRKQDDVLHTDLQVQQESERCVV